jgi:hypothetical protein
MRFNDPATGSSNPDEMFRAYADRMTSSSQSSDSDCSSSPFRAALLATVPTQMILCSAPMLGVEHHSEQLLPPSTTSLHPIEEGIFANILPCDWLICFRYSVGAYICRTPCYWI